MIPTEGPRPVRIRTLVALVVEPFDTPIKAGETAVYFAYTNAYIFEHRGDHFPFVGAEYVDENPDFFEVPTAEVDT